MRTRIISGIIGLGVFAVAFLLIDTLVFNLIISAVSIIALYEILAAIKLIKNKGLAAICFVFVALSPFFKIFSFDLTAVAVFAFFIAVCVLLLAQHKTTTAVEAGLGFLVSFLISFSFSCVLFIRDEFNTHKFFYLLLSFAAAWICDTGAYFVGSFFGKHKLAPNISPKKTIEGAIGGIVSTVISFILIGYLYTLWCSYLGVEIQVSYIWLIVISPVASVIGIIGDLTASIIKRQCDIKDFGNIIPGHGGILDRFDSVLFVLPFIYMIIRFIPIIV